MSVSINSGAPSNTVHESKPSESANPTPEEKPVEETEQQDDGDPAGEVQNLNEEARNTVEQFLEEHSSEPLVSPQEGTPEFDVPLPGVSFGEDDRDVAGQEAIVAQGLSANSGMYQTTYVPFTNSNGVTENLCIYGSEGEYYILDEQNRSVHVDTGDLSPEASLTALTVIADQYTAVPPHLRGGGLNVQLVPQTNDPTVGDYRIPGLVGDPVITIYGVTDATVNETVNERVMRHELGHWIGDNLDDISRVSIVGDALLHTGLGGSGMVQVPNGFQFPATGFVSPTTYGDGNPAEAFAEAWSAFDEAADDQALASYQAAFPEYYNFFTSTAFGYEHSSTTLAAQPQPQVVTNEPQSFEEFAAQWQAAYPGQPVPTPETAISAFSQFAHQH